MSDLLQSTINVNNIYKKISCVYNFFLEKPTLFKDGIDNDFYLITQNDKKILIRISKRNVSKDILFEIKLLDMLSQKGLKVPRIIKTKDEQLFFKIENNTVVCFEYIQHDDFIFDADKKPSIFLVNDIGKTLGELHSKTYKLDFKNLPDRNIFTEIDRISKIENRIIKNYEGGSDYINELKRFNGFAKENESKSLHGIIHNDYNPENLLFLNNKIEAMIDFNWSCYGPFIKDLSHALMLWSFPDKLEKHWKDVFDSFLEGYNTSSPQIIEKNKNLYSWICFSCLSDSATFFADLESDDSKITRINQSRRYQKFKYFEQFI
jgi:Ser/Thr protein kinase RdoA (MazF antagonist)